MGKSLIVRKLLSQKVLVFILCVLLCSCGTNEDSRASNTGTTGKDKIQEALDAERQKVEELKKAFASYRKRILSSSISLIGKSLSNNAIASIITHDMVKKIIKKRIDDFKKGELSPYESDIIGEINHALAAKIERNHGKKNLLDIETARDINGWYGGSIERGLREYFSNPSRLWLSYSKKKYVLIKAIKQKFKNEEELYPFLKYLDEVKKAVNISLTTPFKTEFEKYLQIEGQHHKAIDISIEENLSNLLKETKERLKKITPHLKVSAFAYRRYSEGGKELVQKYSYIVSDLREALTNKK